ncbi:hypothetical protein GQ464_002445 [Rhodocaloribacter litoris]|uniref:hypothetical protein n=1 Tax=Rhodocaloribacter litoris TaxID=2558931 RepID=UPI0014213227|nr:hypothetical protein [Rhodocaloribacter litoris]QXD15828.1 hypothetical protein GQ464_002445 [Rhodocaloribacter litoris]
MDPRVLPLIRIDNYANAALDAFLANCELHDFQKVELRDQRDKTQYYREKVYWIRLNKAAEKLADFNNYMQYNRIFLTSDIAERFSSLQKVMKRAHARLSTKAIEEADADLLRRAHEPYQELVETSKPLMSEIEELVQKRLHFDKA